MAAVVHDGCSVKRHEDDYTWFCVFKDIVGQLFNVPATHLCISGTHLPRHVRSATLRQKLQIKLSVSPSYSILTPDRPVLALTLSCQAPNREATIVAVLKSLV